MSNDKNNNDEQLFIPEALHIMMMHVEAARIECGRMQQEMQRGFADNYAHQPVIPVIQTRQESGTVIDARARFLRMGA